MAMQEGGKAVAGVVDALKSQPLTLALVIINVGLLLLMWRVLEAVHDMRQNDTKMLYEQQQKTQEMLSRCDRDRRSSLQIPEISIAAIKRLQ
jgi:hypothetical protein